MKKSISEMTQNEIDSLTPKDLEASLCGNLYDLYRAFPSLKEWQRREAMELVCKIPGIKEEPVWSQIVDRFKGLNDACRSMEAAQ